MSNIRRKFTAKKRQFIIKEAEQERRIANFCKNNITLLSFTAGARTTPEKTACIEAFHSIVEREVIQRFEFSSCYDAKKTSRRI